MTERWLPVPGSGAYEVSDRGQVWSHHCGRLLKPSVNEYGYRRVGINRVTRGVHQLVLEAFVEARPFPTAECRHLDGDPSNNHPSNLEWGTRLDNAADKRKHGTHNHSRQLTCRRRGHALAGANLDPSARPGSRRCRSCSRGHGMMVDRGSRGVLYDRDVLADQFYGYYVEGGPWPLSTVVLHRAALRETSEGWHPTPTVNRPGTWTPTTVWTIRNAYRVGDEFGPADANEQMAAAGVEVGMNAVYNALRRAVARGFIEKLDHGRYRRLVDPPAEAAPLPACGTRTRYRRHCRDGERCETCSAAQRERVRDAKRRKRQELAATAPEISIPAQRSPVVAAGN